MASSSVFILEASLAGAGVLICATSIVLAASLKLYKQLVYRLAIYQVCSALGFEVTAILDTVQFTILTYSKGHALSPSLCLTNAFLITFFETMMLLFTLIITVHLFCFAVCYRNLKRLELSYVVTSLVVSLVVSIVPFTTKSYGQENNGSSWCWIVTENQNCHPNSSKTAGFIEVIALWFGPALFSLLAVSSLVAIMLCVLGFRACKKAGISQNMTAIKQMLPLVMYPITFSVLLVGGMLRILYNQISCNTEYEDAFEFLDTISYTGLPWSAGLSLLVHILVMIRSRKAPAASSECVKKVQTSITEQCGLLNTNTESGIQATNSSTYYSFPTESELYT